MLKEMVAYLQGNRDVLALVGNGQASLIGVTTIEQKALIEVISGNKQSTITPKSIWL